MNDKTPWLTAVLSDPGLYGPDVQKAVDDLMATPNEPLPVGTRLRLIAAIDRAMANRRSEQANVDDLVANGLREPGWTIEDEAGEQHD